MSEIEMICISKEEYEALLDSSGLLECLYSAGVDNWDGYDIATELYHEEDDAFIGYDGEELK